MSSTAIWVKFKKGVDSKYITIYTKDLDVAKQLYMLPRKNGNFFYLNRAAKPLKKHLFGYGEDKDKRRYAYVRMMRNYPPVAEIMLRHERTTKELRDQMEQDMGWDNVNKTWNGYDAWLEKRAKEKYDQWVAKCRERGFEVEKH